jgi:hypothetical protein
MFVVLIVKIVSIDCKIYFKVYNVYDSCDGRTKISSAGCNRVHADERQMNLAEGKVSRKPQVVFLNKTPSSMMMPSSSNFLLEKRN